MILYILLGIIAAAAIWLIAAYNGLVKNKNLVAEGWSGIDVQLRRRADRIPNLIETVKGYAAHEDKLFRDIAELRAKSISGGSVTEQSAVGQAMSQALGKLFAIAEAYPELKADANFRDLQDKLSGRRKDLRVIAVEPQACPSLTKGEYVYDFGDTGQMTPLVRMYTLGHSFIPAPIHAGGLRYHGMASSICELYRHKVIEAHAAQQKATFEAGVMFARTEGILPAPEAAHAIRGAIDEAIKCREEGVSRTIAFNLCGHGHFDLSAYERFLAGKIEDYELPQSEIEKAQKELPVM